jgi:hypothetical protein
MGVERRVYSAIICTAITVGARMEWGLRLYTLWIRSMGESTVMFSKCRLLPNGCRQTWPYYEKVPLIELQSRT